MKHITFVCTFLFLISCSMKEKNTPEQISENTQITNSVLYLGVLDIQDNAQVEFLLSFNNEDSSFIIHNGKERIALNEYMLNGDTFIYPLHVFDTDLVVLKSDSSWSGFWRKNYTDDYMVNFYAHKIPESHAKECDSVQVTLNGKYEMTLTSEEKERKALALFETVGDSLFGTVMTATGDYRFLNGKITCDHFTLFTFNGESAYRFDGRIQKDGSIEGDFYSGKTRHETWVAVKNDTAELDDPYSIGSTKTYQGEVAFEAVNMQGETVNTKDASYKDKPLVVQILGTWCPNCMDEAQFLSNWLKDNPDAGVSFIGLAFELKDDYEYAKKRITKFSEQYNLPYEILYGGIKSREQVQSFFPFLDGVIAYPTTIYLDKNHKVVKIYTGFSGPASGEYHEKFKEEFQQTIGQIAL